jgi:hypothetical protein
MNDLSRRQRSTSISRICFRISMATVVWQTCASVVFASGLLIPRCSSRFPATLSGAGKVLQRLFAGRGKHEDQRRDRCNAVFCLFIENEYNKLGSALPKVNHWTLSQSVG